MSIWRSTITSFNFFEKLKRPWSHNEWYLKDASENLKIDRDIVMVAVKDDGWNIEFAS